MIERKLRVKKGDKSWSLYGKTNPRTTGVFYCLRLYRKDNGNGSVLELKSTDGRLKFNPITGNFSASIPSQDMERVKGEYLYELTEQDGVIAIPLQRGRLTLAPLIVSPVLSTGATVTDSTGGNTGDGASGTEEDFDIVAYYNQNRTLYIQDPDNPSPLDD